MLKHDPFSTSKWVICWRRLGGLFRPRNGPFGTYVGTVFDTISVVRLCCCGVLGRADAHRRAQGQQSSSKGAAFCRLLPLIAACRCTASRQCCASFRRCSRNFAESSVVSAAQPRERREASASLASGQSSRIEAAEQQQCSSKATTVAAEFPP